MNDSFNNNKFSNFQSRRTFFVSRYILMPYLYLYHSNHANQVYLAASLMAALFLPIRDPWTEMGVQF